MISRSLSLHDCASSEKKVENLLLDGVIRPSQDVYQARLQRFKIRRALVSQLGSIELEEALIESLLHELLPFRPELIPDRPEHMVHEA